MSESPAAPQPLDLEAIRARLSAAGNDAYWRSLDELAETPEYLEFLHREFPRQAADWDDTFGRRHFMKLAAASLSLAGATGCLLRQPEEKIVPYVRQPERIVPGDELFYATATTFGGYAQGVLVKSRMGRPIKIEGNPSIRPAWGPPTFSARRRFCRCTIPTGPRPCCSAAATSRPGIIFSAGWPRRCRASRRPAAKGWPF